MRRLLAVAIAAAALAPAAVAATPSPCALVSADDAAKALGGKVGKGKAQRLGLYRACTYVRGRRTLRVLVRTIGQAAFEKSAKRNPPPVFPIPGVGDEAFSAAGGAALLVWQDGTEVTFAFLGFNPVVQAQKDVAKAALEHL
ncbi:MAG TPA: hypothetical protein VFB42_02240 [Gaiellaceae bacterium]|nr:hypothetical protein [Gaiellaceae bacterium]